MEKFNSKFALTLARLSSIAYESDDKRLKLIERKEICVKYLKNFGKENDVRGFILETPWCGIVVFQGTKIQDWKTVEDDLKFWHSRWKHMRFAAGFYDAYRKLVPDFGDYVNTCKKPLYITGHSLGGAIAIIAAMNTKNAAACYTFGSPRVCDITGLRTENKLPIFRVVHEDDIVPSLPLIIMGYVSGGELFYLTGRKIYSGWQAYFFRIVGQLIPLIVKPFIGIKAYVCDHFIGNYIRALLWNVEKEAV